MARAEYRPGALDLVMFLVIHISRMILMAHISRMFIIVSISCRSPTVRMLPTSPEKTPGGSEQNGEAYYIKDGFHIPNPSTY